MRAGLQTKVKLLTRAGRLTGRRKDLLNPANILAGMNLLMHGLPVPEFSIAKADYSSLGSGYLRLSKGKEVQVLMKGSEEDGEGSKETDWFT